MKILSYCILFFFIGACSPSNTPLPESKITLSSLSPLQGPAETIVTLKGSGFNSIDPIDSVQFNGKTATIISRSDTALSAKVARLSGTGSITVWRNGVSLSGLNFIYDTTLIVSTIGGTGVEGFADGPAATSKFRLPTGIVVDDAGNVFVSDFNVIRKITPDGIVSTFAGNPSDRGSIDGIGGAARFSDLRGLAIDGANNIYAADVSGYRIRKITPSAQVTTHAGIDILGSFATIDGPVAIATLNQPYGVAVDQFNNVYVAEVAGRKIRKISNGIVSTIAGDGTFNGADGPAATASFISPSDVAIDGFGNLFVTELNGFRVRKISGGIVTTFAGTTLPGFQDGTGLNAKFYSLAGIITDKSNNIYVADFENNAIRKISQEAIVKTILGGGAGEVDGPHPFASFRGTYAVAMDKYGNFYITDYYNYKVRKASIN
jgi:serine/threonine protein kinase, bacterial